MSTVQVPRRSILVLRAEFLGGLGWVWLGSWELFFCCDDGRWNDYDNSNVM